MRPTVGKIEFERHYNQMECKLIVTLSHGWEVGQILSCPCHPDDLRTDLEHLIENIMRYSTEKPVNDE